jgi:hypothetical protein
MAIENAMQKRGKEFQDLVDFLGGDEALAHKAVDEALERSRQLSDGSRKYKDYLVGPMRDRLRSVMQKASLAAGKGDVDVGLFRELAATLNAISDELDLGLFFQIQIDEEEEEYGGTPELPSDYSSGGKTAREKFLRKFGNSQREQEVEVVTLKSRGGKSARRILFEERWKVGGGQRVKVKDGRIVPDSRAEILTRLTPVESTTAINVLGEVKRATADKKR